MIGAAFVLTLLVTSAAATRPDVVVIGGQDIRPVRVTTVVERPLLFVNPSGKRFDDGRRRHLHGVVETRDVPPVQEHVPICERVTPARICIEQ